MGPVVGIIPCTAGSWPLAKLYRMLNCLQVGLDF